MLVVCYDCIVVDEVYCGYIFDKEQIEGELQFCSQLDYVFVYCCIFDYFDVVKIVFIVILVLYMVQIFGELVYCYIYCIVVIDGFLIDQDLLIQIIICNVQEGVYFFKGEQVECISLQGEVINDILEDDQDFEVVDFNCGLVILVFNCVVCNEFINYFDLIGL